MMRHLYRILILLLASAAMAAGVNAVHSRGIAWYVPRDRIYPQPTAEQLAAAIERDAVYAALERGAIVIDARPREQYDKGRIPGALHIPPPRPGEALDLDRILTYAAPEDELILYCAGGDQCEDSRILFELLTANGFGNVRLYFGGWHDWRKADMPVEASEP